MLTKVAESKVKISAEFTLKEVQCAVQELKTGTNKPDGTFNRDIIKCIHPIYPMGLTREG